jgi:hypothetical protein
MATRKANTKTTTTVAQTTYRAVGPNIYFDGTSYRVRVIKDGTKFSKNLSSKRKAVQYRNEIMGR